MVPGISPGGQTLAYKRMLHPEKVPMETRGVFSTEASICQLYMLKMRPFRIFEESGFLEGRKSEGLTHHGRRAPKPCAKPCARDDGRPSRCRSSQCHGCQRLNSTGGRLIKAYAPKQHIRRALNPDQNLITTSACHH
jgi:hypothetical protein